MDLNLKFPKFQASTVQSKEEAKVMTETKEDQTI